MKLKFTIAGASTPRANPFDPLELLDYVADLKSDATALVVLYRGGKEYYRYPSLRAEASVRESR